MIKLSRNTILFFSLSFILILLTFATRFYGGADILDYLDSAKFFAGDYSAKIRLSHSYAYGLLHALPIGLTESFIFFKITSLISLFGIVYSVYRITNRDKRALWLSLLSPIVWYMAPWASPIQLASLLFLWSYYFVRSYDKNEQLKDLCYSAILLGLSLVFWDGVLFFIPFFVLCFFYNKKLIQTINFIFFIFVGLTPRLVLDYILFGHPLFGLLRYSASAMYIIFFGGVYEQQPLSGVLKLVIVLLFLPFSSYALFKKNIFQDNKKNIIFLLACLLITVFNSQIRLLLFFIPLLTIILCKYLTKVQFIIQIIFYMVLSLLVIVPYIIQINHDTNFKDFGSIPYLTEGMQITPGFTERMIKQDLNQISLDYPIQVLLVGPSFEDYRLLANAYNGENIKEFVSFEDYNLWANNDTRVFGKEMCSHVKIPERRDFCTSFSIHKSFNDATDYDSIVYAISTGDTLNSSEFIFVKKYESLSIFSKIN